MKFILRIAVILLSIFALNSYADWKRFPAIMGMAETFSNGAESDTYSIKGALFNDDDQTITIVLPITKETTGNIESSKVRVFDYHFNKDIECQILSVYLQDWNGSNNIGYNGWWGSTVESSGTNDDTQTLNTGGISSSSSRQTFIECRVPQPYSGKRSGIADYEIDE